MAKGREKMESLKRCLLCGETAVGAKLVRDYEYRTPMGIVTIEGESRFDECRKCGEEFIPGELIDTWNRQILDSTVKMRRLLLRTELQFIFSVLPYSQNELAKAVGKERSTLTRYKTGENPVDPLFDDALKRIIADFLSGNEDTLNRLRARSQFNPDEEGIRRLKVR